MDVLCTLCTNSQGIKFAPEISNSCGDFATMTGCPSAMLFT